MTALLLLALCLPQEASEAARKARAEFDSLRADVEKLQAYRQRAGALQGEPEKLEALVKEFQQARTALIAKMDGLVASIGAGLEKAPDDAGLVDVRREVWLLYGKPVEALADTERFAKLRPDDPEAWLRLARVQHGLNRFEPAGETLERLLKAPMPSAEVRRLHAICTFATHRFEQASAEFEVLLQGELDPEARQQSQQFLEMSKKAVVPWKAEVDLRAKEAKADDLPRAKLTTSRGEVVLELFENEAPNTVANFVGLVERKFYDGLKFHRVIPGFMAQGGCPKGNGTGDPGYRFQDELGEGRRTHFRGTLSMANSGPDTNGSQFFLTHLPTGWLDGRHTVFGRVLSGQEAVDVLQVGDVLVKAEIVRKRPHEYKVRKIEEK
jgi:cyclophilin family peptidyl-prolyl cis-trans isomerase